MTIHLPQRKRTHTRWLIALGAALTLAFSLLCVLVLYNISQRDRASAEKAAKNVVATLTADIARNFAIYALSLDAVREGLALPAIWSLRDDVRRLVLFDRATTAKHLGDIFAVDTAGRVVINSNTQAPVNNKSSEDYFQFHKTSDNSELFISSPKKINGESFINISRRMTDSNGAFSGIAVGSINVSYFENLLRQIAVGRNDYLSIVKTDGTMIYRSTPTSLTSVASSPIFAKMQDAASGSFEAEAPRDGRRSLYVYSRVGDLPLIVSYAQSLDALYAGARHDAWVLGSVTLLLCLTNLGLIVFLASTLKRRSEAEYASAIAANIDGLTGICNRRRFSEILEQKWFGARDEQTAVSILMIDADHFKKFNDSFGHQSGDAALRTIADTISGACKDSNGICARYGGEEFVIALFESSGTEAEHLADQLRARITSIREYQHHRPDRCPTLSIGYASIVPMVGLRSDDLIAVADAALYEAKRRGRNCAVGQSSLSLLVAEANDKASNPALKLVNE